MLDIKDVRNLLIIYFFEYKFWGELQLKFLMMESVQLFGVLKDNFIKWVIVWV